jgi:predicted transcriptional regulator
MDQAEIEGIAEDLYRRAKLDPDEPANPERLARKLLGSDAIQVVHGSTLRGDGALGRVGVRWRIYLKAKLTSERRLWILSHELAEYALRDVIDERIEQLANAVAAAVLAPSRHRKRE